MRVYLSSPGSQAQASVVNGMDVLVSYGSWSPWIDDYVPSFRSVLYDSGAYSVLKSGVVIDPLEYRDWVEPRRAHAAAVAGLDDIAGDWRRGLRNLELVPFSFPTFHDTDPPELLDDLIALARDRGRWIGVGLKPPREGKERFLRETFARIPDDMRAHGWALRRYTHLDYPCFRSTDSTNWFRDAFKLLTLADTQHLTPAECLEIVVKRYQRWTRRVRVADATGGLFADAKIKTA